MPMEVLKKSCFQKIYIKMNTLGYIYLIFWIIFAIFIFAYIRKEYNAEDLFTAIMCGIIGGGFWPIVSLAAVACCIFIVICYIVMFVHNKIEKIIKN